MLVMEMSNKKQQIPAIRFNGFTDAWEQRELKEVSERVRGNDGRMNLPTLTISAGSGWLDQRERFSGNIAGSEQKNYTLLSKGELSYNHGNSKLAKYGVVFALRTFEEALVPKVYHSFKTTDEASADFVEYMFATKRPDRELAKLVSSGARMDGLLNINYDEFMGINIMVPEIDEQNRISHFLRKLDDTIDLHQRQLDNYKELKKTMLQKMLPQNGEIVPKVRFSGFTENWKQHKLKELLIERNIKQTPTKDIPLVSFTVEDGVTPKSQRYDREFLVRDSEKKYKLTKLDDIVYNPANLKFGAIARNKLGTAVFSPIYITFETNQIPFFIELLVTRNDFINKSLKYQEGTVYERKAVKPEDFLSISTRITSIPEQNKIGEFFQLFDDYIFLHQKKIQDYQQIKKNMLQRMFV